MLIKYISSRIIQWSIRASIDYKYNLHIVNKKYEKKNHQILTWLKVFDLLHSTTITTTKICNTKSIDT